MFLIAANMLETCSDPALANSLLLVKKFLGFVQFIGPIVGMVGLTIHLIKLFVNPENKKNNKLITNWIMAILLLFFFPGLLNAFMYLLDDSFELTRCWNYAEEISEGYGTGIGAGDEDDDDRVPIIVTSDLDDILKENDKLTASKLHFIGDSRTCGMKNSISKQVNWTCESGKGLTWLKQTAIPNKEKALKNNHRVIIMLGVNDLSKASDYATYINEKAKKWAEDGIKTYFVSVNPTEGSYDKYNSKIDSFNSTIKSSLSSDVKYVDTNSYLKTEGFTTTDGLHYDSSTYISIYNKIIRSL